MNKFKKEKFSVNDSNTVLIRHEILTNGKSIVFGIANTDVTILNTSNSFVDFDKESDLIIEKHKNTLEDKIFEYTPDFGFEEINTNEQKWFNF